MKALLVASALVLGFAAPAGRDAAPRPAGPPDGRLVLAVLSPERVIVADPLTGRTRERELRSGTLCHGPLIVTGDRVVYFDLRRGRLVAHAAPLDRLGRDRPVAAAGLAEAEAHAGAEFLTTDGRARCRGSCRRVEIRNGPALDAPPGIRPQAGPRAAFSPDGRRLALPVEVAGRPRFAVVDVERDAWTVAPGAQAGDYAALAWSPSGDWLYLAARGARLLAWRGGSARPRALRIRTGGRVMSIATASRRGSAAL